MIVKALRALRPNAQWAVGKDYNSLEWIDTKQSKPTEEQIQEKIAELQAAEPMRLLRIKRNQLLAQTDWIATIDYPGTVEVQEQWLDYRQALRDLPANSDPQLDENGNLININWPTQPENS